MTLRREVRPPGAWHCGHWRDDNAYCCGCGRLPKSFWQTLDDPTLPDGPCPGGIPTGNSPRFIVPPDPPEVFVKDDVPYGPCDKVHRAPEGPNEDIGQCRCWRMTFEMRPEGETYGHHLPDCSLPIRHESYCQPGGQGHPPAPLIRGYWPELGDR